MKYRGRVRKILTVVAVWFAAGSFARGADDASTFFETKVRPVLATHCVNCHGPAKQKAGLRLDTADGMTKGGESGRVIVPGNPEKSRLVEALSYHDSDLQMPPKGKLPDGQIEAISRWVKAGAVWPSAKAEAPAASVAKSQTVADADREFWSFRKLSLVEPPTVQNADWNKTAVDRFLLAAMAKKGLAPSPRASKLTLIRRVTFDLTGLPPTSEEIDAFLKDESPEAYAKVVDRLLKSPHHGERWGRHWLDLVRYGEDQAHTFQARMFPQGYLYRDWVVKSLNSDMPYDRFVQMQIAGDLMPGPDSEREDRLAALGLFGLGASYYAGSPTAVADERDDKIDTLCRSTLGLTVACARCHDHKYDPISTADYYSLSSIMASTVYKEYPKTTPALAEAYDKSQVAIKAKTDEIAAYLKAEGLRIPERLASEETAKYVVASWVYLNVKKTNPKITAAEIARKEKVKIDWLDRWVLYLDDKKAPETRPYLARWKAMIGREDAKADLSTKAEARAKVQAVGQALQDYLKATLALREAIRGFEAAETANASVGSGDKPKLRDSDKKAIQELASIDGTFIVKPGGGKAEGSLDEKTQGILKAKRAELEALKKAAPPKYDVIHGVADTGSPTTLRIHLRGNPATLGDEAPRRFLEVLSPPKTKPFSSGSGRLELATAIASQNNPLFARVMVNRVWAQHFGRGIVATPSNLGAMGDRPSHPELLEWLSNRLITSGWSLKALHRDIVMSAAYSQMSEPSKKATEIDGENVYLSHFNRRRLEVEAWRDAMLAVTGELESKLGGPSVDLTSADNRRRTIYAKISRHKLDPLLRQFDFPDPNLTSDKRNVSTVPLQGLFVLNSEFMAKRAEALASKLTADAKLGDEARIKQAFTQLYGRPAASDEVAMGLAFLKSAAGTSSNTSQSTPSAWAQYAQVLLGTNEFLFVD